MEAKIRKATIADAERISYIWEVICAERIYSAVSIPFTTQQEKEYITSLSEREAIFVAEMYEEIIGFQSLDLWCDVIDSFMHVCQIGTFVLPDFRGKGIGYKLTNNTFEFARKNDFKKIVIYVRKGNERAIRFYHNLGFILKGELKQQVLIDGKFDDEIFMEIFL